MPTLEEWENALASPRRVLVESSPGLLHEIQQRHANKDTQRQLRGQTIQPRKGALSTIAAFAPQREVRIAPAYMLHRLGVVTTPAIENLADICSTWAYLRYLWAFEIPPPGSDDEPLRLSEAAKSIDFHQKGLLSDQIGVGMAAVLLGTYLDAPLAADVSVAMDDPAWPIELQYDTSPDYLFFDAAQANLFVVECKGTQSSRSASLEQLRRGTEQVPSLMFTDGRIPPSLVVATCLSKRGTSILIIDPPGENDQPLKPSERPERVGPREWRVRNDAEFARATRLISEAKVLSFAGAYQEASGKLERAHAQQAWTPRSVPRDQEVIENEFGSFRGIRQRVGLRDRFNIDVVQGLDLRVYEAFIAEEPARTDEVLRTLRAKSVGSGELIPPVTRTHEKNNLIVRSFGPDGSLLEVHISPP